MEVLGTVPDFANLESGLKYGDYIPLIAFGFLDLFFSPLVCPIHNWRVSFPQTHLFPPICCLQWPRPPQHLAGTSLLTELRCSLEWLLTPKMREDIHYTYDKGLQNQQGKSKQKYSIKYWQDIWIGSSQKKTSQRPKGWETVFLPSLLVKKMQIKVTMRYHGIHSDPGSWVTPRAPTALSLLCLLCPVITHFHGSSSQWPEVWGRGSSEDVIYLCISSILPIQEASVNKKNMGKFIAILLPCPGFQSLFCSYWV